MAHALTYYSYDLMSGTLLAELPLTGVTYSKRLNSSGAFRGSLSVVDMPTARQLDLLNASRPMRTLVIIDVDGTPQWGGIITARGPQSAPGYFIEGDDIRWIHDPDDRFPIGFDVYMRCVGTDYTIADRGLSTVKLSFNPTNSLSPTMQLPL